MTEIQMFKPLIIIPCYNHAKQLKEFLPRVLCHKYPILIVDDGCDEKNRQILDGILKNADKTIFYLRLNTNSGKGKAIIKGIKWADENGYTHLLQIDSDGQHNTADIEKFFCTAKENPNALIKGVAIHDKTIPKSRYYAKKITAFWVVLETGSMKIGDVMCGFRLYPLAQTLEIIKDIKFFRMGFDIEIAVKAHWHKIKIINLKTKVTYPKNNTSNFRIFKDNVEISKMHAILFFTQITRIFKRLCLGAKWK